MPSQKKNTKLFKTRSFCRSLRRVVYRPLPTRWAAIRSKWSYKPYKWPYKWVTGVITPLSGVITRLMTGRGPSMHIFPIVQILIALYQHFISLASRSNFTRKHPSNGRWSVGTREMRQGCQWPSRWHSTKSPEIWSEREGVSSAYLSTKHSIGDWGIFDLKILKDLLIYLLKWPCFWTGLRWIRVTK